MPASEYLNPPNGGENTGEAPDWPGGSRARYSPAGEYKYNTSTHANHCQSTTGTLHVKPYLTHPPKGF